MDTALTITVIEINGQIDESATDASYRKELSALVSDRATYLARIENAVHAVFDSESAGTRINLPHVVSLAIAELKVSPKDYGKWEERVLKYVRDNSKGEGALFDIGKGSKNGGVARKPKPAATTESASVPSEGAPSTEMVAAAE
jgi:hypothetical protein